MPIPLAKQVCVRLAVLPVFVLAALALSGAAAPSVGADAAKPRDPLIGLQAGSSHAAFDAAISWNTFLGGSGADYSSAVKLDTNGNLYVAGESDAAWQGTAPPVRAYTPSSYDGALAKLGPSGQLIWNTFLGGAGGDSITDIALDAKGNIYVTGGSNSTWGMPMLPLVGDADVFVAKLNSSGELVWNTFLGGTDVDHGHAIAVDGDGNIYVAGECFDTWGSPVNPYAGEYDVFVAKLDTNGALIWNTFLGSTGPDGASAIAVDGNENVYLAGYSLLTWGSPVHPFMGDLSDVLVAKLNSSGELLWHTFLGGSGSAGAFGVSIDASGEVYVTGGSTAPWQAVTPPVRPYTAGFDGYAAKLDSSGVLLWHSFVGGSADDTSYNLALDRNGNVYVTGYSFAAWGSPIRPYTAWLDAYVAELNSDGRLLWNTFLGGGADERGYGIAVDADRNVSVTGYSTGTWDSPVRAYSGEQDIFVSRLAKMSFIPFLSR